MWEVLLSQGEPFGTRSPELHEPLRTGTWELVQVFVDSSPVACVFMPSGKDPQETLQDYKIRAAGALDVTMSTS